MALRNSLFDKDNSTATTIHMQFVEQKQSSETQSEASYSIISKELGEGGASTTHLGFYEGQKIVVKKYRYPDSSANQHAFDVLDIRFLKECRILKLCSPSPHVVAPVANFPWSPKDSMSGVILIEYVENGDLEHYINKKYLTFEQRINIVNDVALGLLKLLESNFAHRDIKTANILLTEGLRAKICDFDLSTDKNLGPFVEKVGTSFNLAPEFYKHATFKLKKGGLPAADVFSFGTVLVDIFYNHRDRAFKRYEDLYGNALDHDDPAEPTRKVNLLHEIIDTLDLHMMLDEADDSLQADIKNIMKSCLNVDPEQRPTMQVVQEKLQSIVDRLKQLREEQAALQSSQIEKPEVEASSSQPEEATVTSSVTDQALKVFTRTMISTFFVRIGNAEASNPQTEERNPQQPAKESGCSVM